MKNFSSFNKLVYEVNRFIIQVKTYISLVLNKNVKFWVIIIESERGWAWFSFSSRRVRLKARARLFDKSKFVPLLEILHGSEKERFGFAHRSSTYKNTLMLFES